MNIAIIDYGMGNLQSVANAFRALGCTPNIIKTPEGICAADRIVLPGVGAFPDAIGNLKRMGWIEVMQEEVINKKKPFLGICLGMQLLATSSTEYGMHNGLSWVPGRVVRMENKERGYRIPHIGWNDVHFINKNGLYAGFSDPQSFYFVHSYIFIPDDKKAVSGICSYGMEFAASIEADNIHAVQFHPEKSHRSGLNVLKNFLEIKV